MVLAPALVIVGSALAAANYHGVWQGAHFGPQPVQAALTPVVPILENICSFRCKSASCFRSS